MIGLSKYWNTIFYKIRAILVDDVQRISEHNLALELASSTWDDYYTS